MQNTCYVMLCYTAIRNKSLQVSLLAKNLQPNNAMNKIIFCSFMSK